MIYHVGFVYKKIREKDFFCSNKIQELLTELNRQALNIASSFNVFLHIAIMVNALLRHESKLEYLRSSSDQTSF